MYFYEVWVRSNRYHGNNALTYHSSQRLSVGSVVSVPLQNEQALALITDTVAKPSFATKQIARHFPLPPMPKPLLELGVWLKAYYPAPIGLIAQQFLPPNLNPKDKVEQPYLTELKPPGLPPLSTDQAHALDSANSAGTYLLHGITGSGKTRVYLELAWRTMKSGQSSIILTPEISLTSQLSAQLREVFGERVVVLHSQLSPKERRLIWQRALTAGDPLIIVGPRSALFSPLKNIGLVVLDEAHEPAYKQEQAPHYQAGRVAAKLATLHGAILILGSATPSVNDYFLAQQKHKPILELSSLAQKSKHLPTKTTIVDLKDRSLLGRHAYLSMPLLKAIELALLNKEQVLLYLNRRGTARIILCENCGWQALCPHCDLPLTYHSDSHSLRCHICNYRQSSPTNCPVCAHPGIIFRVVGTKAVAEDIARLFPGARVQRFDTDNLKSERFEQHYESVRSGEVDILVGTQLLAKGLDLPRLSTLGIINADTSLAMPDFSTNERTYQLLTQVLGRVGRGHIAGKAIIQTYQPDHMALQAAVEGSWLDFYQSELDNRRIYNFPPFCYMLKLTVRRATSKSAEKAAQDFVKAVHDKSLKVIVEGPAPAFHEKFQSKYQWQVICKSKVRSELLSVINLLPTSGWSYDIDPIDLL